jgi:dTDP-4-dehydrorhamnose reductase
MRILITGASGFVGRNLTRFFADEHTVTVTFFQSATPADIRARCQAIKLDIREPREVIAALEQALPDVVIHAAGNKNVKYCEQNPQAAHEVNAEGTRNIARACRYVGARMMYLSTDLVFDCASGGYTETAVPAPTSAYGKSKLAGERFASDELDDVIICRSGGIYGPESPLLAWLTNELNERREVLCLTNVRNTPTYVESLSRMMHTILLMHLSGIFHTVGSDIVSRFQFFHAFATAFGLDARLLRPVNSEELMRSMLMQPNAALDSTWTRTVLRINDLSLQAGMSALKSCAAASVYSAKS